MIDYNDTGRGDAIVLIHGFCEDKSIWSETEDLLAQSFRVIAVDLPGFGHSLEYPQTPSMRYYADEIKTLLQDLGIEIPILIGHSLGGYVALAYSEKHAVKGICLVNSSAYADTIEKVKSRNKVIDFLEKRGVDIFLKSFVSPLFASENQERCRTAIEELIQSGKRINRDAMQGCVAAMRDRKDRTDVLRNSTFPIFYIIGKQDSIIPFETSQKQITEGNNISHLIFEDVGHMAMIEKPKEVNNAILKFCEGL